MTLNGVTTAATDASRSTGETSEPLVACILVTWNGWQHTDLCLRALLRQEHRKLVILVVDNGSTDGTVEQLRSAYPSVMCIETGNNSGFARACNIGARAALEQGAEYIWFLNNDTSPAPETLRKLLARAASDRRIGIVGAVLLYMHDPARIQAWGGGSISLWSGYNRHQTAPAAFRSNSYITFASALVQADTFRELGGLWEEIFLYFEDSDFSLRATGAGWRLAVAEDTAILHAEGGSAGPQVRRSPALQQIQARSGVLFLRRHGRIPVVSVAIFLLLRVGKRIAQRDWAGLRGVLRGAVQGVSCGLPRSNGVRKSEPMS